MIEFIEIVAGSLLIISAGAFVTLWFENKLRALASYDSSDGQWLDH